MITLSLKLNKWSCLFKDADITWSNLYYLAYFISSLLNIYMFHTVFWNVHMIAMLMMINACPSLLPQTYFLLAVQHFCLLSAWRFTLPHWTPYSYLYIYIYMAVSDIAFCGRLFCCAFDHYFFFLVCPFFICSQTNIVTPSRLYKVSFLFCFFTFIVLTFSPITFFLLS